MNEYKLERKALYIAFIDFKQAFDRIRHKDLLLKLLRTGVSNKLYGLIKYMYTNITLNVQSGDGKFISLSFISLLGVRQGDNLSPTLFNIFVNDIPNLFDDTCKPVQVGYMNISCMLYADDLIILSETFEGLQTAINNLESYCDQWGLTVNSKKTKFMTTKVNSSENKELLYKNEPIELVKCAKYLGIEFSYDGNNEVTKSDLYKRALKAYFEMLKS